MILALVVTVVEVFVLDRVGVSEIIVVLTWVVSLRVVVSPISAVVVTLVVV